MDSGSTDLDVAEERRCKGCTSDQVFPNGARNSHRAGKGTDS